MRKPKRRPTYQEAVEWIALNGDTSETRWEVIMDEIVVGMAADLFGTETSIVAGEVSEWRENWLNNTGQLTA